MDTAALAADLDALHTAGVLTDQEHADALARLNAAAASTDQPPPGNATTAMTGLTTTATPPAQEPPTEPADTAAAVEAEPAATQTSAPCPVCAVAPTVITTATPAAIPATAIDGSEVAGGAVVHACPNCGAVLEQFETTLDDAWATVEQRWLDSQHPAEPAPADGATTHDKGGQ